VNSYTCDEQLFNVVKEIIVSERVEQGRKIFILKNQINNKFFKFDENQYKLLNAFNGKRSTDEVLDFVNNSGVKITAGQLNVFKQKFIELKLISNNLEEVIVNKSRLEMQNSKTLFQKLLFIKFTLINPDLFVEKILSKTNFIYSPIFIIILSLYIVFGISLYIIKFSPWESNLVTNSTSKNINILLILYLITILASWLHEMAHAVTCKKYGGKVNEIGMIILYFRPGLFCNISDSYLFKEKKHRIYVSIAGIILDLVVWSTILIIGYAFSIKGVDIYFIPLFGLYGLITIFLEFNPLIKLDGYYVLTEFLGIYNLREKSYRYLKNYILRNDLNLKIDKIEKRVYLIYSITSSIYCTFLVIYTFYVVIRYLMLKLSYLGILIAVLILGLMFFDYIKKLYKIIIKVFSRNDYNIGG
jgi:putative peptide zinc metalloprotease protein